MTTQKVYYLNDETKSVTIHLIDQNRNEFHTLEPQEGLMFELSIPEGSYIFIKRWDYRTVLISYGEWRPASEETSS